MIWSIQRQFRARWETIASRAWFSGERYLSGQLPEIRWAKPDIRRSGLDKISRHARDLLHWLRSFIICESWGAGFISDEEMHIIRYWHYMTMVTYLKAKAPTTPPEEDRPSEANQQNNFSTVSNNNSICTLAFALVKSWTCIRERVFAERLNKVVYSSSQYHWTLLTSL